MRLITIPPVISLLPRSSFFQKLSGLAVSLAFLATRSLPFGLADYFALDQGNRFDLNFKFGQAQSTDFDDGVGRPRLFEVGATCLDDLGKVAHIEDVVVDKSMRGYGLGKKLIEVAIKECQDCYKIILDCSDENVEFYKKCRFKCKENQMVIYK